MNPLMTFRSLPALTAGLALALAACSQAPAPVAAARPVLVTTIDGDGAGQGASRLRVLPGFVASRYQADVGFQVAGRIQARLVEVGASVRQGQPLMRLQPEDYRQGLSAAEDQLQAARVDAEQSAADARRFGALVASGAVSAADQERQQARADAARARLDQLTRQVAVARNRVGYTTLTAPFSGTVTALRGEVGQVVGEGQPVLSMAREDVPEVVVDVPEDLSTQLPAGLLQGRLTGSEAMPLMLRLREVAPAATLPLRSYRASFTVVDPSPTLRKALRLGMTAEVNVALPGRTAAAGSVVLPASAIMSDGRSQAVWVVTSDKSVLTRQVVQVQRHVDDGVVVGGLSVGQRVVIAGTDKLGAGLRVRAIERSGTAFEPGGR